MLIDLGLIVFFVIFIRLMNAILLYHLYFDKWFFDEIVREFRDQMMIIVQRVGICFRR
jgi:hypothetical protein